MYRTRRRYLNAAGLVFACAISLPAKAAETITYSYDALGRLIGSLSSGGPATGTASSIQYDPAGNRNSVQITGSPNPPIGGVVVVPINGLTVIPLPPLDQPY